MAISFELTLPFDLNQRGPLIETISRGLPPQEALRTLVERDKNFTILLQSIRRLTAIYQETPTMSDIELIQKEIFLATRTTYDLEVITKWFHMKEEIKGLFYPWVVRFGDEQYDTAFEIMTNFIDLQWVGDIRSPYHYLARMARLVRPKWYADSYSKEGTFNDELYSQAIEYGEKEVEDSVGFGMKRRADRSIFADISIEDVPKIIHLLHEPIDKYFALRQLGYLDGNVKAAQLRSRIDGIPQDVDMRYFLTGAILRVKERLRRILASKQYDSVPDILFADLVEEVNEEQLRVFFHKSGYLIAPGSNHERLLRNSDCIDSVRWHYNLTDTQRELVNLLTEKDQEGLVLRNMRDVTRIKQLHSGGSDMLQAVIFHLFDEDVIFDERGRKIKPGDIQYRLIASRDLILQRVAELSNSERNILTHILELDQNGNPLRNYKTLADFLGKQPQDIHKILRRIAAKLSV